MKGKSAFDDSFMLTRKGLLVCGVDTFPRRSNAKLDFVLRRGIYVFNFIWLYHDVIGELIWIIQGAMMGKSILELSFMAPCTTICILSSFKSAPLYLNINKVIDIINKLRDFHPDFNDNNKSVDRKQKNFEKKIADESVTFLNIIIKVFATSCTITTIGFIILPVVLMSYEYNTTGGMELKLPFLIVYFFDPFTKYVYVFVYIHQFWSTIIVVLGFFSMDSLLYEWSTYIQMQFRILSHCLENMDYKVSEERAMDKLLGIVERHKELIGLVVDVEKLYTTSTLFNMITSSIIICLCGFNVVMLDDVSTLIVFVSFMIMSVSQTALLCYFGDLIMISSMEVVDAVYKSKWYNAGPRVKKILRIIMTRARKPCKLTASNFADLKLTVFATILGKSWSYFALLNTMYG